MRRERDVKELIVRYKDDLRYKVINIGAYQYREFTCSERLSRKYVGPSVERRSGRTVKTAFPIGEQNKIWIIFSNS